jgi:DNA-binding CsgD family transcriptional regulator
VRDAEIAALANWYFSKWQRAIDRDDDRAIGALERLGAEVRTGIITKHHDWEANYSSHGWDYSDLTAAEHRVLVALAEGLTYEQAGERLRVSRESVKDQVKTVRQKIGARNTPHAIAIALRKGIIQ